MNLFYHSPGPDEPPNNLYTLVLALPNFQRKRVCTFAKKVGENNGVCKCRMSAKGKALGMRPVKEQDEAPERMTRCAKS